MNLKNIFVLVWKDVLDSLRTPRLLLIVITPLLIALSLRLFFGNQLSIRIAVYSPEPTQLITVLEKIDLVELEKVATEESLRQAVLAKRIAVGVILPPQFDALLADNAVPTVEFLLLDNSSQSQAALSLVQQTIQALSAAPLPIKPSIRVLKPEVQPGVSLRGDLPIEQYAIILWLVMGLVGNGVMLVPTLIVEERERKTLDALLLSPLSYAEITAAKSLTGLIYCLISSLLILGVQGGLGENPFLVITLLAVGGFALSLFGVLLGSLSANLHVLNSYGSPLVFVLTLPAFVGMLGTNPILPYLQWLPTYPLTQGIVGVASGQMGNLPADVALLAAESLLILALVVWSLKRQASRK